MSRNAFAQIERETNEAEGLREHMRMERMEMTKQEIAVLGHAFFDGKTLQFFERGEWKDWIPGCCPNMSVCEWRIKPDEPKTITICTHLSENGYLAQSVFGSAAFKSRTEADWTHIKSLDQVVEVE